MENCQNMKKDENCADVSDLEVSKDFQTLNFLI